MKLEQLGWDSSFEEHFKSYENTDAIAGRVISRMNNDYIVITIERIYNAKLSGKYKNASGSISLIENVLIGSKSEGAFFIEAHHLLASADCVMSRFMLKRTQVSWWITDEIADPPGYLCTRLSFLFDANNH